MCVHTRLLSLSSGLCRTLLAPATLGFCIKRLVNDYFFPSHDFTALDGFQISSPTSCTSLQLIAQKADQPASHRQRGLGEQYTKLLGFGNAGSLLPSSPNRSSLFIAARCHRAAWNWFSLPMASLHSTYFAHTGKKVKSGSAGGYLCDLQKIHVVLERPQRLGPAG